MQKWIKFVFRISQIQSIRNQIGIDKLEKLQKLIRSACTAPTIASNNGDSFRTFSNQDSTVDIKSIYGLH